MGYNDFQHHQCWWIIHDYPIMTGHQSKSLMMDYSSKWWWGIMGLMSCENVNDFEGKSRGKHGPRECSYQLNQAMDQWDETNFESGTVRPKKWQELELFPRQVLAPRFYRRISTDYHWKSISKILDGWLVDRWLGEWSRNHPMPKGPEMLSLTAMFRWKLLSFSQNL